MRLYRGFGEKEKPKRAYSRKSLETIIPKIKQYIKQYNTYPGPQYRIVDAIIYGPFAEGVERCEGLNVAFILKPKKKTDIPYTNETYDYGITEALERLSARINPRFMFDENYFEKEKISHISINSWE